MKKLKSKNMDSRTVYGQPPSDCSTLRAAQELIAAQQTLIEHQRAMLNQANKMMVIHRSAGNAAQKDYERTKKELDRWKKGKWTGLLFCWLPKVEISVK